MTLLPCRKTFPRWTQFTISCLIGELSLKVGLLFVSSFASFTTLTTWSSQHSLRIDLKGLLIHTSKGCTLDVHPAGTFTNLLWPTNIAAAMSSVKWALNKSIAIKDLWKPISLLFRACISAIFFTRYHHRTFIHPNPFLGDNTEVIRNSKIFNSAVSFTREDDHWW